MTILLTGGTGFIGSEVVRQLAAAGEQTRVMVRRPSRAPLLAGLDVEPLFGDLTSIPSLARAVKGVDVVIHLGGRATFEPVPQRWWRAKPNSPASQPKPASATSSTGPAGSSTTGRR